MSNVTFSEIETEFLQRVHTMVWCSMATRDTKDRLRSRILHPLWEGAIGWASARPQSLKARHIAHCPYVSLAYISDMARPVYVDCTAEWEKDDEKKRLVWELFKTTPPPAGFDLGKIFKGMEDPEYGVLKFTPWRIELFDISNAANRKVWRAAAD